MRPWTGWMLGCTLACVPAASAAQGLGVAPSIHPRAAATVDSLLDAGTAALLAQAEALTAPGRDVSGPAMDRPCGGGAQSGELAFAGSERPLGIVSRAVWEIRASRIIRQMPEPQSICFPPGRDQPTRVFANVIRFNSRLLATERMAGRRYLLQAYRSRDEADRTDLGYARAATVCASSSDAAQYRLAASGRSPVSSDVLDARWVHYQRQAAAPPAAAPGRPRCRRVETP